MEKRAQVGFGDPEAGSPAEEKVSKLGYGVRGRGQGERKAGLVSARIRGAGR